MSFVRHRFKLANISEDIIRGMVPQFGYNGFGEFIFYRTYSRVKDDGGQEDWADVVIRTTNGTFSIRKDWYLKNQISWDEYYWQGVAQEFAISLFKMEWMPPGRGLWAMGSNFVYERGSMALYNCAYVDITTLNMDDDVAWLMDSLMCGVGVGFGPIRDEKMELYTPRGSYDFVIPDTREGWADSERRLLRSYLRPGEKRPRMIYDEVRGPGLPIRGFGGVSSGPEPLKRLHELTVRECEIFRSRKEYDSTYFKANIPNHVGVCVVAGNVRRSAELMKGRITDQTFINLKDYERYPEREAFGWMCVDRDTWIATSEGPRQVSELIHKPFVARIACQNRQSMGFFSGGEKSSLRLTAQGYTLDCSVDHKIMTARGWVRAHDLLVGDSLVLNDGGIYNGDWSGEGTAVEGYVLGVLVGDGTMSDDGHCSISSSLKDPGGDTIRQSVSRKLGELRLTCGTWKMPPSHIDSEEMRLSCGSLAPLAKKYGIVPGVKRATRQVERASSDFCRGFLQGLFDTDGSVERLGSKGTSTGVRLSQSDLGALQSVQRMLSRFNIQSRITSVIGSEWARKQPYVLTIRSESVNWFRWFIGFGHETKKAALGTIGKHNVSKKRCLARLDAIEQIPPREMFDCTVEGIHAYDANGIFVSNSNNSVELDSDEDFMMLGEIARRVIRNGEPGYINRRNMPFARIGKDMTEMRLDKAVGFNPCGEIPLEHREVCNLCETLPTVCDSQAAWLAACRHAGLYATTVSLLPTHQPSTNRVVARNRRIGVGIIDYTGWKLEHGVHRVTKFMREGYDAVVTTARLLNDEAGVPWPIRYTCVKPGGTTPKLPGRTSGIGHPTFDYTLRAVRVARSSPVRDLLVEAGVPNEPDIFDPATLVFYWPIHQGPAKPAYRVTLWEQAFNLITVQREWADNAVANTLYFKPMWPMVEHVDDHFRERLEHHLGIMAANLILNDVDSKLFVVPEKIRVKIKRDAAGSITAIDVYEFDPKHEEDDIEPVLSAICPLTKSVSLLPHSANGAYAQMPESGISEDEYYARLSEIQQIDWSKLSGSDGSDEMYCTAESCAIVR